MTAMCRSRVLSEPHRPLSVVTTIMPMRCAGRRLASSAGRTSVSSAISRATMRLRWREYGRSVSARSLARRILMKAMRCMACVICRVCPMLAICWRISRNCDMAGARQSVDGVASGRASPGRKRQAISQPRA